MKNLKRIDEAVGSILERRASADRLLKDVVKGNASEVEGIKLSKEMAQGFLDWLKYSTYGKKFGALPFNMLFTAAFNWGLDRFVKGANTQLKAEFKELKAKAKQMGMEQKMKAESLDEKRSSPYGEIMLDIDAASKQVKLPMSWMKDYVKSIERMAKRNAKRFFKDYGSFSVDDWVEDMEYNFANESKVNEARFVKSYDTKVNDAETEKEVKKIYPKYKKVGVGKLTHFFGELEPNLFFKAYYAKTYKQDTGKSIKGDFKITSVYSFRNGNGVELMKESIMENFKSYSAFVSENYDTEQRKEMAAKGFALADGSFPIANLEDLKNAIMAYGRAKDQAKAAKFIAKRAKALGAEDLIPDTEDFQKSLKG